MIASDAKDLAVGLDSKSVFVRAAACEALGKLGDPGVVGPLIRGLGDEYADVREPAHRALVSLGSAAVEPLIAGLDHRDRRIRAEVCRTLGDLGDSRAAESLILRLSDSDQYVRQAAQKALGKIGDSLALGALIAMLGDRNDEVRQLARKTLERHGEGRFARAVVGSLDGDRSALDFLRALAEHGDVRAIDGLIRAWEPGMWGRHEAAFRALKVISDALGPRIPGAMCRTCLARLEKRVRKCGFFRKVEYYVCRSCHRASNVVFDIHTVLAVLDAGMEDDYAPSDGEARGNWLRLRKLFDFDCVEIVDASDEDVQRFCVQVGNDTDEATCRRYGNVPVRISPKCRLEENTLRILKGLFGQVSLMVIGGPHASSDREAV